VASGLNLREQLKKILPDILPRNPAESIKGTELIQLVKYRLHQNYSDATLRYHFSIMSCDPSSPIAKVEQGQGYYLRSTTIHSLESARNFFNYGGAGSLFGDPYQGEEVDVVLARANKFRVIVSRSNLLGHRFPFSFERSFSHGAPLENQWRYPDLATVEWLVGEAYDDGMHLDPRCIEVRRRMGGAAFRISAVTLKLETHYGVIREQLFKALSSALWANQAELVVASEVADEQLVAEIRKLADAFGIGVTSLGLSSQVLDDLPEAAAIRAMRANEFEALQNLFTIRKISLPRERGALDWDLVNRYRAENEEFAELYDWLSRCLTDEEALTIEDYREQLREPGPADREIPQLHAVGG
jgi:hypothetical protein